MPHLSRRDCSGSRSYSSENRFSPAPLNESRVLAPAAGKTTANGYCRLPCPNRRRVRTDRRRVRAARCRSRCLIFRGRLRRQRRPRFAATSDRGQPFLRSSTIPAGARSLPQSWTDSLAAQSRPNSIDRYTNLGGLWLLDPLPTVRLPAHTTDTNP